MLSQSVDYALRAMVFLADNYPQPQTNGQIAKQTKVPRAYLSKLMQNLARFQLVRSQRGLHGGFVLARDPSEISLLEVVNAVDPFERIQQCPLELETHGVKLCPLHRRLDNALASVEAAFGDTTLAEILAERSESTPLCQVR